MASMGKTVWRFARIAYIFHHPLSLAETVRSGRQPSALSDAVTAAGDVGRILTSLSRGAFHSSELGDTDYANICAY
jgi:hypothetical protein